MATTLHKHICRECDAEYLTPRSHSFLCSPACKAKRHRREKAKEIQRAATLLLAATAAASMSPED